MQTVTVDKTQLLEKLSLNRLTHLDEFDKAHAAWRRALAAALRKAADTVEHDGRAPRHGEISLPEPKNMGKEYEDAIGMLQMHIPASVDLDLQEYRQYILDQWSWADQVKSLNNSYLSS